MIRYCNKEEDSVIGGLPHCDDGATVQMKGLLRESRVQVRPDSILTYFSSSEVKLSVFSALQGRKKDAIGDIRLCDVEAEEPFPLLTRNTRTQRKA